jgi:hypothetical protein
MPQNNCQKINQFYNTLVSAKKELAVLFAGDFQGLSKKEAIGKGIGARGKAERSMVEFGPFKFEIDGTPVKIFPIAIDYLKVPGKDVVINKSVTTAVKKTLESEKKAEPRKTVLVYLAQINGDIPENEIKVFMDKNNFQFANLHELLTFNDRNTSEVMDHIYISMAANFSNTVAIYPHADNASVKELVYLGPLPISLVGERSLLFVKE